MFIIGIICVVELIITGRTHCRSIGRVSHYIVCGNIEGGNMHGYNIILLLHCDSSMMFSLLLVYR